MVEQQTKRDKNAETHFTSREYSTGHTKHNTPLLLTTFYCNLYKMPIHINILLERLRQI